MKKLERLNNEKFKVSEKELTSIKGGYTPDNTTWDTSLEYFTTYQDNTTTSDVRTYDICRDW
jgi:hypothetical protein